MKKIVFLIATVCVISVVQQAGAQNAGCNAPRQCYGPPNCNMPRNGCYGPPPNCYMPQNGCYMPQNGCYCPPQPDPEGPQADRPGEKGAFVTPPPTGETVGATNSMGLRMGSLRIPEITIPLPTFKLPHLVHYRRNQEVQLDKAVAAFQRNAEIMDFGQLADRPGPNADRPEPKADRPKPQCCQPVPPAPCCAPPEGCANNFMGSPANAWQNTQQYELTRKQAQVDQLKSQVSQLKEMVDQLARRKLQEAQMQRAIKPVGFEQQAVDVGEYCAPLRSTPQHSPTLDDKLDRLERQISAIAAAQAQQNAVTNKPAAESEPQSAPEQTSGKTSLFSKLKGYFKRG